MELDVKFLITLGGLAASIIGASAVAKYQLKNILEELRSLWSSVKKLDQRLDKKDVDTERQKP